MPLGEQLAPHFARQAIDRRRRGGAGAARSMRACSASRSTSCAASSPSSRAATSRTARSSSSTTPAARCWPGSARAATLSGAAQVDGVLARRQPGSTLKPFVYELAFEKRLITPATLIDDSPAQIATGAGLYLPQNYDHAWKGFVSARTALGASLNVPAVRVGAMLGTDALLAPQRARPRAAGKRRLVRRVARARQRRRSLLGTDQRLPRPRQRRPHRSRRRQWRSARAAAPARVADAGRDLSRHRHPRRQQRARPHLRLGQPARDARLRRGQDRHQQGHARQLVRRLHRPLHDRRLGRQRERRGDARRQRRQRRGAGLAGDRRPTCTRARRRGRRRGRPASSPARSRSTRSASRRATSTSSPAASARCCAPAARCVAAERFGITSPRDGSVFAIDPDIPPAAQRITFEGERGTWRLDGRRIGAGERLRWAPWPGRHRLELVGASGQTLQSVAFEVRGAGRQEPGSPR